MGIFPKVRGENKKYLSCHHLENQLKTLKKTQTTLPAFLKFKHITFFVSSPKTRGFHVFQISAPAQGLGWGGPRGRCEWRKEKRDPYNGLFQSKIEWDRIPTDPQVSC